MSAVRAGREKRAALQVHARPRRPHAPARALKSPQQSRAEAGSGMGEPQAGSGTSGDSLPEQAGLGEVRGSGASEIRESHRGRLGGLVGAEGGGAPRGINSRPGFDRRCGGWRCRPPPPRRVGRGGALGAGGVGEADSSVLVAAAGGRGGGAEAGGGRRGPGAGRGRGPPLLPAPGSVSPPSPRRLGVCGAARAGALRGAARRCFVSSSPSGAAPAAGEARLPPDARPAAAAAAAASPRPCRGGRATPRSSLATRRAGKSAGSRGWWEGAPRARRESLAVPSAAASLRAPAPRLCCLLRGLRRGFPEAVAVTTAGSWGRGLSAPGNGQGAGLAERERRAARLPAGSAGRGAGPGDEVRDPGGGDGLSAAGSPCLHLGASHLCREADCADPPDPAGRPGRGSGSGGSASWEGPGGRAAAAGAGAGRRARGGTWEAPAARVAWRAGEQFPSPSGLLAASYLSFPALRARAAGCTRSFFYSLSQRRPPAAISLCSPGVGRIGICFLNKTKTGSVTRASSDRLQDLSSRSWPSGTVLLDVLGAREEDGEGSAGAGAGCLNSFASGAAEPLLLLHLGVFIPCQ